MTRIMLSVVLCAMLASWHCTTPAQAQSRVFVAALGSDANPCTFSAPCRSFQKAHDTVTAGGEIDVLDPAGYGALTITKPISIQGHGYAGLAVPSGDGITINAGSADKISLRGLLLDGIGTGASGIAFSNGASLDIQDCVIRNFAVDGINFQPGASSALLISGAHIAANLITGINVVPPPSGTLTGAIERVVSKGNGSNGAGSGFRLFATSGTATTVFTIAESVMSNNANNGIGVFGGGGPSTVTVWHSAISNNNANGLLASGNTAVIRVTRSMITGNDTGLSTQNSGSIVSFGDNSLAGNTTSDGAPTSTIAPQ
jgi:hypothetical protein